MMKNQIFKPRNYLALDPLLKKGHFHQANRDKKTMREFQREIDAYWLEQSEREMQQTFEKYG
jgi:hypothetical protein